ncbi:MAG TPA: GMC family oxidoreductase N-terminal domain-containing protein [Rhodopila sp.]|uniref:GMC family oxidoreductase n=1 Tax=Rhodopila sp. TaxID=2480087 RepID=UPI002C125ACC|nr:GMC family oxidoreductase N-terminal domain-containing protein [Rhodopila sp.]HVY18147.1 GMC family oxidoreductase N-terminal domain-containing protein [Rhodopila sp.]
MRRHVNIKWKCPAGKQPVGKVTATDGDTFDFVIVGSGAAGSVLCACLTEDPDVTACVVECGPPDRHPFINVPTSVIRMLFNPACTWQFQTEPGEGINSHRIPTAQDRTLGGSNSINGMIYNHGQRENFDSWAQRGNRGWGYVDILPYFKRGERRIGVADKRIRGHGGSLPVTSNDWIHPVNEVFIAGLQELGIPRNPDYNSGDDQADVGYSQRAINGGYRHSAARVFLHPAQASGRPNILADARAARNLFEGKRARGVRYVSDRATVRDVFARKEVIVSCGSANTAKLLQMSDIGPTVPLQQLDVETIADLPVWARTSATTARPESSRE